jgi:hypothetical protein
MSKPNDKEMAVFDGYAQAALIGMMNRCYDDPLKAWQLSVAGSVVGDDRPRDRIVEGALGYAVTMMRKRKEMLDRMEKG